MSQLVNPGNNIIICIFASNHCQMNRLFLLLFGMVTFVAHAQVPDYVPTDGLVVWYPLDGDATDFGPFNIQPEYAVAEPAANRFEQEGRALSFIGDEDFIQGHADLFPVTDRTLSFWFNMPLDSPENWLIGYGGGASGTSTLLYSTLYSATLETVWLTVNMDAKAFLEFLYQHCKRMFGITACFHLIP